jgi:RES domain-containing protein
MKLAPNPIYNRIVEQIGKMKHPFTSWQGLLFRASPLQFAQARRLLDGMGGFRWGGRWSAAGTFPSVNASTDDKTALTESKASFAYYNWASSDVRTRIIVGVKARFSQIVDLTNSKGLGGKGWLDLRDMLAEDWRKLNAAGFESRSQALGRAAHDCGAEGLLVSSARISKGINLVYFPQALVKDSKIELLGEDDIKRWIRRT